MIASLDDGFGIKGGWTWIGSRAILWSTFALVHYVVALAIYHGGNRVLEWTNRDPITWRKLSTQRKEDNE